MEVFDYTLCYSAQDGKLHIGRECSEEQEVFVGTITDELAGIGGYSGDGNVLRLKDFSFATSADIALAVPDGTTIILEGKNEICVVNDRPEANVGVLYSSGDLTLDGEGEINIHAETGQGLWSRAVCARGGDLTVNGGTITANGGRAKKSCGLYAGGRLWIDIGEKGKITINGGFVSAKAGTNAIRAAVGRLTVAAGAEADNVKEFGGIEAFQGDCLSSADADFPLTIRFR